MPLNPYRSVTVSENVDFFHMGRGFLPLLAVMLLATPQLAFAQNVTVNPRSLDMEEGTTGDSNTPGTYYTVVLDTDPGKDVEVKVIGAPTGDDVPLTVSASVLTFTAGSTGDWNTPRTVTVTAPEDENSVGETVRLTHTATVGEDGKEMTLRNATVTVKVTDNDPRGVTVTATLTAGELLVDEADNDEYTVVLDSKPTATVTVDVGGASGEITVSPSRLFFIPDEWDVAQTVTVYAGVDFDADPDTATLTHIVRGGDYSPVSAASVKVRVTDPDTQGVSFSTRDLTIAAGGTDTYTVVLDTQPKSTVTITMSEGSDDVTVTSRLSFSTSDWNRPKSVTVRLTSNATTGATVSHTAASSDAGYNEIDLTGDDVGVTVATAPPTRLTVSRSSLRIAEGLSGTYTVRLASAGAATVAVAATGSGDVTVDPRSLTFVADSGETNSWNVAQTVTVMAAEDEDGVDDIATLTHTVGSESVVSRKLAVTVTDNDRRGVTVTPTSLEIPEGADGTYTVALVTEPTGTVTVAIAGASGDVTVKPSQLTFAVTGTNAWFNAQQVTVSAADDDDGVPDAAVTLRHTVRGGDYDRLSGVDNVRVTITENDRRSLTVMPDSLPIMEGETGTYTVELDSRPTGTVTVRVRGASGDVTVDPSRLIFTTGTWSTPQEVEVTAGQDADAEPDSVVTLTHAASGGGYNGVTGGTVTVTIDEDDIARKGVTVTPTALTVDEGGPAMSYTVVLNSEPTGTVSVRLGGLTAPGSGNADTSTPATSQSLVVTPTRLAFTRGSWSIPQAVTVRAPEDDDGNGTTPATPVVLTHDVIGGGYDDQPARDVSVTVRDNDTPGLLVTPMDLQIPAGSSREYTVALKTKPAALVTVAVDAASNDLDASPSSLTFTAANWKQKKTVRVHADVDAPSSTMLLVTNDPSGEPDYTTGVRVNVDVLSAESNGVAISPKKLTITEGESDSYTVVLTKAPEGTVTVRISGASDDVTVSPTRLSFSTGNWNREQTVRVRVAEDDDADTDAEVHLVHTVTGGGYDEVSASNVVVTPKEVDTQRVTVNPTLLTIAAGVSGTYQVRLETEPSDTVTVMVDSPTKDVTVDPKLLIFTPQNWNRNQTVTVTVDEDAGGTERKSVTLTHQASGGDYAGVDIPDVTVAIPVEGTPSEPRGLSATAGDQRVTLRWSAPSSDGGSAITRYEYRYRESGGSYGEWTTVSGGASATSRTVTGLDNGTTYEFQVRARNAIGPGTESSEARATLDESAPGAPARLTATGGDESVTLNWSTPGDGGSQILRYEYRYGATGETWGEWMTVSGSGSARRVAVSGLTNGTLYAFQVRAVNSVDAGEAAEATATPGRAPSAPTGLAASVESESITVMWGMPADDGGSAIVRYEVNYRESGGQWSGWMTVAGGASATSHTIMDLTNGIGYEIAVRAVNAIDPGPAASVEATPMEGINFAHFANGESVTSDIVLVNVETSTVTPAIYFYNQMGEMIPADSVVDLMGGLEMAGDGSLTVPMGIVGRGEMTISTNGEGSLVIGSVRVFASGRMGGVLRFDIPTIGVAGVGASEPVSDAIFPARRMAGGIRTGAAIRNLSAEPMTVTCQLMRDGDVMDTKMVALAVDGHSSEFIDEMFPGSNTTDFVGSVRCTAPDGGMFAGVALELDTRNGIFTTLPVVPYDADAPMTESRC